MSYLQLGLIRGRAYGIANESCDMAKDKIHKLMVSTGVVAALTSTEDALGGITPVKNFDVGIGRLRIAQNRNEGGPKNIGKASAKPGSVGRCNIFLRPIAKEGDRFRNHIGAKLTLEVRARKVPGPPRPISTFRPYFILSVRIWFPPGLLYWRPT